MSWFFGEKKPVEIPPEEKDKLLESLIDEENQRR